MQFAVLSRFGIRKVLKTEFDYLDSSPRVAYSKDEMEALLHRTARGSYNAQPLFILPGTVMFAGGLLAARRGDSTLAAERMAR
ncbi:hypothetical protein [Caldimonas brevitalea]|uniref:Uncharacterized protein n=1 Tax=Caldimonas brevitalea TaxID=413882 RepID=A0A0G3BPU2_9BURK|nr:hypothetical protein [Caldimonas brevitalea]AKJ31449.1 hypothetical protein AAW51_4758 [Caldimonas brevitalea]